MTLQTILMMDSISSTVARRSTTAAMVVVVVVLAKFMAGEEESNAQQGPPVTVSETLLVSFGALSGGFAVGVLYQFRKQNRKFDLRRYDFALATKALLAGTVLCFSTFGILGSIFVYTTGVTSFHGLRFYLESMAKGKQVHGPSEEELTDKRATQGMTISEEWNYFYTKYISPEESSNEREAKRESTVIDESMLHEKISEEELLEWEEKMEKKK
jgi:hypothetical protein